MQQLEERINDLTAREVNGVYKPTMEPGRIIEDAVDNFRHMFHTMLDDDYPLNRIHDLRLKYHGNNNARVSNGIAKGVARRAEAIFHDIISFKSAKRARGGSPGVERKSRKSKKQRKAKKSRKL
jgi:hypothetical protein